MSRVTKPRQAAFIFVFMTVALDMLALGVVVPVLPQLVEDFVQGDTARAARLMGLFGTGWALMQFLFQPILGGLSDRFGRRPVVLLSSLGLGLDYLLMALAPSWGWLFIGRLISGITAASYSTAAAYIADVTPSKDRAEKFGMLGAAFGFGFVVGPAMGGLLGDANPRLPFWVAGALSLLNTLYGIYVLPESLPKPLRRPFDWRRVSPLGSLKLFRSSRTLLGLAAVCFMANLAHEVMPSVTVLYTHHRYHWNTRTVGFFLAAVGVSSALVQGGMVRVVVKACGERAALLWGTALAAIGFFVYGIASAGWLFIAGVPLWASFGVAGASTQTLMTRQVDASSQGHLQGGQGSLRGVTGIVGPGLFSLMFAKSTEPAWAVPGLPYMMSAMFLLLSLAAAIVVTRPREQPSRQSAGLAALQSL